jgi:hypothetical protein
MGISAEMPMSMYERLQAEASEYLTIEVSNVETEEIGGCRVTIAYSAVVLSVMRSGSGTRAGDKITIKSWSMKDAPSCIAGGPKAPILLVPGWAGKAYLNPVNGGASVFNTAAYGESFLGLEAEK